MRPRPYQKTVQAKARCLCTKVIAVAPPAGGDGSRDVFRRHDDPETGARCVWSRSVVPVDAYVKDT